jgi:hypothetical protein
MSLSGIAQFILGFFLAIALLLGGSVAAAFYLATKLTALPPKPTFEDETTQTVAEAETKPTPKPQAKPKSKPKPKPSPTPTPLEPGAYRATVTWPEGLLLRGSPSYEAARIGGIAYEQEVVVLGTSEDGVWERVRVEATGEEGWVKGGNTQKLSD